MLSHAGFTQLRVKPSTATRPLRVLAINLTDTAS